MDDGQNRPDGWEAQDLRSGVAKVYGEAKRRTRMGGRVLAAWSVILVLFGLANLAGVGAAAPAPWDFGAGIGGLVLAAVSASMAPATMASAGAVVLADLVMTAHRIPENIDNGSTFDQIATIVRLLVAPAALFVVLNGYFGSLSIQAFKKGFSPGADWRTRMSPALVQMIVLGAFVLSLGAGVASWAGSVMLGFERTDVVWMTKYLVKKKIEIKTAKPAEVMGEKGDGKEGGIFAEFKVLDGKKEGPKKLPETVWPILTTAGLDEYAKGEVEDAYRFAKDATEQECLLEGEGRQDRCRDERCRYWARVFTRACLPKSRKTEHFCDDVPDANMAEAGASWAQRLCAGRKPETCREILYAVQGHCHTPVDLPAPAAVAAAPAPNPSDAAAIPDSETEAPK